MFYDFVCDPCDGLVFTVQASITEGPTAPMCPLHGTMRRLYSRGQKAIVQLGMPEYIDKAYRGEELPAGMTQSQVRAIVDTQMRTNKAGRANARRYKTLV